MGGSRCTYRNCTVRSDGVVHMFHYPVYDKIRCHQWLVNAQRLDFLNLKLSQVRNRVVCQHHFKNEYFMNYRKEKLTFEAVPTENGPYCDSGVDKTLPVEQIAKAYSIAIDEVEENNKYIKRDLKAKSSIIYADFLTNGDVWEKQSLNETIWNNMVTTTQDGNQNNKDKMPIIYKYEVPVEKEDDEKSKITLADLIEDTNNTKISEFENPLIANMTFHQNKDSYLNIREVKSLKTDKNLTKVPENSVNQTDVSNQNLNQETTNIVGINNKTLEPNIAFEITDMIPADQEIQNLLNLQNTQPPQLVTSNNDFCAIIQNPNELSMQMTQMDTNEIAKPDDVLNNYLTGDHWKSKKAKVTILSEKTIYPDSHQQPVMVQGQLEPISPSVYIHLPKKAFAKVEPMSNIQYENKDAVLEEINTNVNLPSAKVEVQRPDVVQSSKKKINKPTSILPKQPSFKHKISPERVAAIEKKRSFNKRLRDIIELCLDKLDEPSKTNEDSRVADSLKITNPRKNADIQNQNIATYLSKQEELPNSQEFMMNYLEARMKKMENTLIGKIEQNSQRIVDLKKYVTKTPQVTKDAGVQTSNSDESYKKQLYQEISQFLSPNANSLIYEELFINKYGEKLSNSSSNMKRKRDR